VLTAEHFALAAPVPLGASAVAVSSDESLAAAIRGYVERMLAATGGNKTHAARRLDISRQRLDRILSRGDDDDAPERTSERSGS
jgi:DNA-binding NtrC family response regulator